MKLRPQKWQVPVLRVTAGGCSTESVVGQEGGVPGAGAGRGRGAGGAARPRSPGPAAGSAAPARAAAGTGTPLQ